MFFRDFSFRRTPVRIESEEELLSELVRASYRGAHFCELTADSGAKLLLGVSVTIGCAQYSEHGDDPPYLMALAAVEFEDSSFEVDGEASPIPARFCIPMGDVSQIASVFFRNGACSELFRWELI